MEDLYPLPPMSDAQVIEAMRVCGGSPFTRHLAVALAHAAPNDLASIKAGLPILWDTYTHVAALRARPRILEAA